MDFVKPKREEKLYAPIMNILEDMFNRLGECHFENTSRGFSEQLKDELDDDSLFILKIQKMFPDLTGYLIEKETFNIIVAEVKDHIPTLRDIYQTKKYAETLNASYGLLVSPKRTSVELRRFLIKRKGQITRFFTNKQVLIGLYNEGTKAIQFEGELCSDMLIDKEHYDAIFKYVPSKGTSASHLDFVEKERTSPLHLDFKK
jgi:hypothetical protein